MQIGTAPQITRVDQPQTAAPAPQSPEAVDVDSIAEHIGQHERQVRMRQEQAAFFTAPVSSAEVSAPTQAPPATDEYATPTGRLSGSTVSERIDSQAYGPPSPHRNIAEQVKPVIAAPRQIEPLQAVWEVDVFNVPGSVADLFFDAKRYQQISERMSEAVKTGLQSVLVTSSQTGEGRSSVAIGIAMAAAASGIRVALVDGDTAAPTLADELRLELQYGWIDTVRGGLPIKEIAVLAVEDGVTLIPLMLPNGQGEATAYEVAQLVELLKNSFDLILIDGPSAQSFGVTQIATAVDAAILVRDVTRTHQSVINQLSDQMYQSGIQGVGVVDNFV
jgi:Mrp family chromosome partitioning ATPase